jgi:hypothetical protein
MEVRMSPNQSTATVIAPESAFALSGLSGQPADGRLEWLAAVWARQTGRPIVIATPR